MDLVPTEEWVEIFDETWRRFRDFFYVPNMHGYDWEALRRQYLPWLEAPRVIQVIGLSNQAPHSTIAILLKSNPIYAISLLHHTPLIAGPPNSRRILRKIKTYLLGLEESDIKCRPHWRAVVAEKREFLAYISDYRLKRPGSTPLEFHHGRSAFDAGHIGQPLINIHQLPDTVSNVTHIIAGGIGVKEELHFQRHGVSAAEL
jgi:hypothetical protein